MGILEQMAGVERKYQVFISSPYRGLESERRAAINAVLDSECIPVGMEMFPPTNDDQFTFIKRIIDESDFYIVMLGDSYGSIHEDTGLSYTEMEFDYAESVRKPILVLISANYGKYIKQFSEDIANKYKNFRKKLRTGRVVNEFKNEDSLKYEIASGLRGLRKNASISSGYVKLSDVKSVLEQLGKYDEEDQLDYLKAIETLSEISIDEELWEYVHDIFHNMRDATHSLLFDPAPRGRVFRGEHVFYLKNSIINLKNFIEGIVGLRVRVTIKAINKKGDELFVSTVASTTGRESNSTIIPLDKYSALSKLYSNIDTDDMCYYKSNNILKSIEEGEFGPGRFDSVDDYLSRKRLPYLSTLCVPIRKIDYDNESRSVCRGFLCIDSPYENVFIHDSIASIACSVADVAYLFMTVRNMANNNQDILSMFRKKLKFQL